MSTDLHNNTYSMTELREKLLGKEKQYGQNVKVPWDIDRIVKLTEVPRNPWYLVIISTKMMKNKTILRSEDELSR